MFFWRRYCIDFHKYPISLECRFLDLLFVHVYSTAFLYVLRCYSFAYKTARVRLCLCREALSDVFSNILTAYKNSMHNSSCIRSQSINMLAVDGEQRRQQMLTHILCANTIVRKQRVPAILAVFSRYRLCICASVGLMASPCNCFPVYIYA